MIAACGYNPAVMLMRHKVTHENLIDSNLHSDIIRAYTHFRNISEICENYCICSI